MNRAGRTIFFIISGLGLLAVYLWALKGLPEFGHYRGPYGDVINAISVYERHATDAVTAVNFDYRGFDTLGEEFILFTSVMGGVLLLRRQKSEEEGTPSEDEAPERQVPPPSDATRVLTTALVGPMVLFGLYIVTHGQLTPGGGFQGGVILATAPLLVYLAGDLETFERITSHTLIEVTEAAGAFGYGAIGFAGMIAGGVFLQNVAPMGTTGMVNSSGTIPLISLTVGLEVSGGFVLLLYAFLEEMLRMRLGGRK